MQEVRTQERTSAASTGGRGGGLGGRQPDRRHADQVSTKFAPSANSDRISQIIAAMLDVCRSGPPLL